MSLDAPARRGRSADRKDPDSQPGGRSARRAARGRTRKEGTWLGAAGVFLLPSAVALAFILRGIGERPLSRAEQATWWASSLSLHDLSLLIRSFDVVFTPYYVLMHVWVEVLGDSATVMRLPGAVGMAASAGLLALLGRRLFTPAVGLCAGLALAVLPTVTRYGQEARPYPFAVAAVLLSTLLLAKALHTPSFKVWVAYTLSVPLIGWHHLVALGVLAAHLPMILQARRSGDRIVGWAYAAAAGLGLCFIVPMAAQGASQSDEIAWVDPGLQGLIDFPAALFGSWAVAVPVMALGLLGLLLSGRYAVPLAAWAVLPPLLTFLTADLLHLFLPRYLLFTAPAWVLLAAAAICRVAAPIAAEDAGRAGPARQVIAGAVSVVAVAALAFQALPGLREARQQLPEEPDFRTAAQVVGKGMKKSDGIVFSGDMYERRAMAYEMRDDAVRPKDVLMYRTAQRMGSYDARECPEPANCLAGSARLWLVSTSPDDEPFAGMPKKAAAELKKDFRVVRTEKLRHVNVLLLQRAASKSDQAKENDAAKRKVHT